MMVKMIISLCKTVVGQLGSPFRIKSYSLLRYTRGRPDFDGYSTCR